MVAERLVRSHALNHFGKNSLGVWVGRDGAVIDCPQALGEQLGAELVLTHEVFLRFSEATDQAADNAASQERLAYSYPAHQKHMLAGTRLQVECAAIVVRQPSQEVFELLW